MAVFIKSGRFINSHPTEHIFDLNYHPLLKTLITSLTNSLGVGLSLTSLVARNCRSLSRFL